MQGWAIILQWTKTTFELDSQTLRQVYFKPTANSRGTMNLTGGIIYET
jgi:hypothetical protein